MEPKSLRSKLRNIKPSHAFHKLTDRLGSKVRTGSTETCQPRALTHTHDSTWGLDPESTGPSASSSTRVSGVVAGDTPAPHPASTQQPLSLQAAPGLSIPLAPGDTAAFQSKNHESAGKPSGSVNQKQTQAGSNMVVKNHESNCLVEEKDQDPSDDNASYHSAPTDQAQQDEQLALQLENDPSPHLPNGAQLNQATTKPTSRRTRLRQRFRGSAGSAHQAGWTTSLSGWKECQELRQYGRQISVRCSKCASDIYVGDHKVVRHTQDMMMNAQAPHDATSVKNVVHSSMFCQRCNSLTCVGCGEAVDRKAAAADETTSAWTEGHDKRFRVNWHCGQGRLFMIWLFSAGYDYKPPPPASPTSHRASLAGASYQRFSRLFSPFGLKSDTTATPGPATAASPPSSLPSLLPTWDMVSPTPAAPVLANADVDASGSSASGAATATSAAAAVPTTLTDSSKGKSSTFWGSSIGFSGLKSGGLPEKGTGYGRHDSRTWTPTFVRSPKQEERERIQEQYLGCLAVLVPTTEREESQLDEISPRLVELMIRRSPLVPLCVDLLRSHAMDELAARSELYSALCAMLTALARHSATAAMLFRRTRLYPEREQTVRASIHTLDGPAAAAAPPPPATEYEETTSLRDLIGAFVAQCRLLLAHSLAHSDEFKSDEDVRMLELCERMCRLAAVLEEREAGLAATTAGESETGSETSPPSSNSSGSRSNNKTNSNSSSSSSSSAAISAAGTPNNATVLTTAEEEGRRHRAYQLWWEVNRVNEIPESEMLRFFSYHSEAAALSNRTTPFPKGRMRKLIKDHMTLRSGLPEGVFVQLCASRMDVYKVMIVGPRGTPYENGLFEFDLFCGADYPYQPPQLRFRTTGGGRVRFNPNLYDNGLVCLSLLGTWGEGQRWDPNSSTLLQVLVSIQAMVFCEEPYYNEPGHELHPKPNDSERENARMREMTLEYAMMSWLRGLCPAPAPPRLPIYKPGKSPSGPSSGSGSGFSINLAVPALPPPPSPSPSSSSGYTNKPGIWEDLVREHFRANAATILRTARGWKGTANGDKIKGLVLGLEKLLEEHKFL